MKKEHSKLIDPAIIASAAERWIKACAELDVQIVAPFILTDGEYSGACIGFLPNFGGPNGMVIGAMDLPSVAPDSRVETAARRRDLYISFVNASAFSNSSVDDRTFKEALEDWGYFGPQTGRPKWLPKK
jgi:hypothetical protein